jgi:outer membrane receptor for ferric coprogen and ferric-rhodotorulic acid
VRSLGTGEVVTAARSRQRRNACGQMTLQRMASRTSVVGVLWLALVGAVHSQEPKPVDPSQPDEETPSVQEVGGRLVVSGETVVVSGYPDTPPRDSSVATKIDTPLIETPRSVSIIDRRTLDDMGAVNITQAHEYTVGLTPLDERGPGFARGFPVDFYDLRRDGLRTYSWSVRELAAIDRIQYLRGPAGVLYGDGSPGALVNMVLKKPLAAPRYGVRRWQRQPRPDPADSRSHGPADDQPTRPVPDRRRVRMARERLRQRRASSHAAADAGC